MSTLKIESNNGFLQMEDLPQNCIFNKVVTGCGGTTIVLFNERDYIIAVPTTELITNKTGLTEAGVAIITAPDGIKTQSVFGLFGEFTYGVQKKLKDQQQNQQNQDQQQDQQQEQKEEEKQNQQQNQDQQQNQQQQDKNEMSKENAQQLLNAVMQDEKDVQEKVKKMMQMRGRKLEKDW